MIRGSVRPEDKNHQSGTRRIIKVKLDTMSLISAAIAVAIWVVVIWTAIAAIVAHI
jgi:hypothetical protein